LSFLNSGIRGFCCGKHNDMLQIWFISLSFSIEVSFC